MADTMEILFGLGGGQPPPTQWWLAKLILFNGTYLFFVPYVSKFTYLLLGFHLNAFVCS